MIEQHEGWADRIELDPVQAKAQGVQYTEAAALVVRDCLLRRWANDPANAQWHPSENFELMVKTEGEYGNGHRTWLHGRFLAVFRPDWVPVEVLDHVHGDQCRHDLGSHELIEGAWSCSSCGDYHFLWSLCPERCVSTEYAVRSLRAPYVSPEGP